MCGDLYSSRLCVVFSLKNIVNFFLREPGEWALERAKMNVNENFLLVGILEELEDVLLLLERFLPHYFKDVLSIYKNPGNSLDSTSLIVFYGSGCPLYVLGLNIYLYI